MGIDSIRSIRTFHENGMKSGGTTISNIFRGGKGKGKGEGKGEKKKGMQGMGME